MAMLCWAGAAPAGVALLTELLAPNTPVLPLLSRLQCDNGMSVQALARTSCCPSEGRGPLQSASVDVGVSLPTIMTFIINSDSIHAFLY